MKVKNKIRFVLGNICVVCSIVMVAARILDWYNPYMDFMGHTVFLLYLLCLSSVLLSLDCIFQGQKTAGEKTRKGIRNSCYMGNTRRRR